MRCRSCDQLWILFLLLKQYSFLILRSIQVVGIVSNIRSSSVNVLSRIIFHTVVSPVKYTYPIAAPHNATVILRKYGFHGISYSNILSQMSIHLGKPKSELNLIVAHLGAGSSICAIKRGKSVDTTMGLTPLEGTSALPLFGWWLC
jgi:acetate kinase